MSNIRIVPEPIRDLMQRRTERLLAIELHNGQVFNEARLREALTTALVEAYADGFQAGMRAGLASADDD